MMRNATTSQPAEPRSGTLHAGSPREMPAMKILLVEDEQDIAQPIISLLEAEGHDAIHAPDGETAIEQLARELFDLVIADIRLPGGIDGLDVFRRAREQSPGAEVVLMTAYGTVPEAVDAMRSRATHYLAKPFDLDELLTTVREVASRCPSLQTQPAGERVAEEIVGVSRPIEAIRRRIAAIASSGAAVLITGESGTGKELVAQAIHRLSGRSGQLVAINCAAFPEALFEAELFGHERGAFTGANRARRGRFRTASQGTLFLDEISEMPLSAQAKLLRVLQEARVQPLGSDSAVPIDVRVISASNVDLKQHVQQGTFREDLYYRLKVFQMHVPPLRERRADLIPLVGHFLRRLAGDDCDAPGLSPRAWAALHQYSFPGNVRELAHALEHAIVLSGGREICVRHLPDELHTSRGEQAIEDPAVLTLAEASSAFEREYLVRVLRQTCGNRTQAAELLRISRKNLWQKVRRYEIRDDEFEL